jgi:hypothetical protein
LGNNADPDTNFIIENNNVACSGKDLVYAIMKKDTAIFILKSNLNG